MSRPGQVKTALIENLKELRLPAMLACFEDTARRAEKETLSYEHYLLELAERECEQRHGHRIRRLLQRLGVTAGEVAGELRSEAITGKSEPAAEGLAGRRLLGSQGELAGVWES